MFKNEHWPSLVRMNCFPVSGSVQISNMSPPSPSFPLCFPMNIFPVTGSVYICNSPGNSGNRQKTMKFYAWKTLLKTSFSNINKFVFKKGNNICMSFGNAGNRQKKTKTWCLKNALYSNINKFVLGKRRQFVYTLQNLSEKILSWKCTIMKTTKMKLNWWQILYMKTLLYQTHMASYIIQIGLWKFRWLCHNLSFRQGDTRGR